MGHILFASPDSVTKECFITLLKSYMTNSNIRATTLPSDLRPGDLGAIFTSLSSDDILLIENEKLAVEREFIEIIENVMEDYCLDPNHRKRSIGPLGQIRHSAVYSSSLCRKKLKGVVKPGKSF